MNRRPLLVAAALIASCASAPALPVPPTSLPTGTVSLIGGASSVPASSAPESSLPTPTEPDAGAAVERSLFFATENAELLEPPMKRMIEPPVIENTLRALIAGPTIEEMAKGAVQRFASDVTLERVELSGNVIQCIRAPCPEKYIARLHFTGNLCSVPGSAFNEASLIFATMVQFREIAATKIYLNGETMESVGTVDSTPECLQP